MLHDKKEKNIVSIPMFVGNDNNYTLILHDDKETPLLYVFIVLCKIFQKAPNDSLRLMEQAEQAGSAVIDVVSYEEGKAKLSALKIFNTIAGWDLKVTMTQN